MAIDKKNCMVLVIQELTNGEHDGEVRIPEIHFPSEITYDEITRRVQDAFKDVPEEQAPALDNFRCPKCGHEDADGGSAEIEHNQTWQHMSCPECGASWTDVYTLTNQIMDEGG